MNKHAIKNGVISGLFFLLILVVQFLMTKQGKAESLFTAPLSIVFGILSAGILIGFMIIAVNQHKGEEGTPGLPFGAAWLTAFVTGLVGSAISTVGNIVMMVAAPAYIEARNQVQIDKMYEQGMPEEQIDMAVDMMSNGFMSNPMIVGVIALFSALLMSAILALIVAAIFKGKQEENPA